MHSVQLKLHFQVNLHLIVSYNWHLVRSYTTNQSKPMQRKAWSHWYSQQREYFRFESKEIIGIRINHGNRCWIAQEASIANCLSNQTDTRQTSFANVSRIFSFFFLLGKCELTSIFRAIDSCFPIVTKIEYHRQEHFDLKLANRFGVHFLNWMNKHIWT